MFLKVQQNTRNIKEHKIMFGDEENKFVDDNAMIIKIEWRNLLVCFHIEEMVNDCMKKRLIWAVTFIFLFFVIKVCVGEIIKVDTDVFIISLGIFHRLQSSYSFTDIIFYKSDPKNRIRVSLKAITERLG